MAIIKEYIDKRPGVLDLQNELQRLIDAYNKHTDRYLFVYAADLNKGRMRGVDVSLVQDDFYTIQDILRESDKKKIDFYIETPGGSGEAAEEIAKFLRKKFNEVNFVIAAEAKSAGTILVLSGDNIFMTDTGSLGPIDAQVKIGRSMVSAHDYKAWVDEKKAEAARTGNLNPFDAIMVAQISPGELYGVINSLEFAKDLVKEWLEIYKFKNWTQTETSKKIVTQEMRKARASEVAEMFCDHTTWRSHGRSLKIDDLKYVLTIERIDNDPKLAEIVYRIKTVIGLLFGMSTIYKLFFHEGFKLFKNYAVTPAGTAPIPVPGQPKPVGPVPSADGAQIGIKCPQCGKEHEVTGYFDLSSQDIQNLNLKTNPNVQDNDILICDNCKFTLDLKPIKSQVETQTKRKFNFK